MTQDEIIRMAREACAPNQTFNSDEEWVKRFAALVAAHEREACAKVCAGLITPWDENTPNGELIALRNDGMRQCAAAIRAINFEGDTGFRPVSEMIAEHKQDPKKAAAIEKAKMRKAEQEPVAIVRKNAFNNYVPMYIDESKGLPEGTKLYAAPGRTKDLTDAEIMKINVDTAGIVPTCDRQFHFARAVIDADRELNR